MNNSKEFVSRTTSFLFTFGSVAVVVVVVVVLGVVLIQAVIGCCPSNADLGGSTIGNLSG